MEPPLPRSRIALGAVVGLLIGAALITAAGVLLPAAALNPSVVVGISLLVTVGVLALALGSVAAVPLVWPSRAPTILVFILFGLAIGAAAAAVVVVVTAAGLWKLTAAAPIWAAVMTLRESGRMRGATGLRRPDDDRQE